ncbi:MAG: ABC transporter ATP-binding protein [Eubacterium sp.]|nr:ABC transporter ATP-binding protein [Eubacterium sp.]
MITDTTIEKITDKKEPLIHCDNLVKIYKTKDIEVMALQGLDFDVNKGELIAIIGKSGSGKSTLLNILGGLEKPTAGYIMFDGDMISEISEKELCEIRSNKIGYVWQHNTDNLLQYLTAVQNVEMPLMFTKLSKKEREQMAKEALDKVGLSEKYNSYPTSMSGGEQQRVAIATAIVNKPELLLMDEPTGAVDKKTSDNLQDLFRKLNKETGITIIIVTHDMSLSDKVDRVVMISDGKISSERVLKDKYQAIKEENGSLSDISASEEQAQENGLTHEEFMILDKAGRVRLSPEMQEAAGINSNRVRIDIEDGKIVIRSEDADEENL